MSPVRNHRGQGAQGAATFCLAPPSKSHSPRLSRSVRSRKLCPSPLLKSQRPWLLQFRNLISARLRCLRTYLTLMHTSAKKWNQRSSRPHRQWYKNRRCSPWAHRNGTSKSTRNIPAQVTIARNFPTTWKNPRWSSLVGKSLLHPNWAPRTLSNCWLKRVNNRPIHCY